MTSTERRPRKADRTGILIFALLGVAIVVITAVGAVRRIVDVVTGGPIDLLTQFVGAPASVAVGTNGDLIDARIESGFVTVPSLSPVAIGAGIIEPIITLLTVATVVACLIVLALNILRGTVFGRAQTRCTVIAGLTGIVGFALSPVFGSIAANDALFTLTGATTEVALFAVSPLPFLVAGFAVSIVITAFTIGERMQHDSEGLI